MRVTFIGTGEAYGDSNTSILLQGSGSLLLDCGHLVPPALSRRFSDPGFLDAVFISHWHADHIAGLVPLCMRWRQEGRTRPLRIIGPVGLAQRFRQLFDLLYTGFYARSTFPMVIDEVVPGQAVNVAGFRLTFAHGQHLAGELAVPVLAVRAEHSGKTVCYSGDTIYSQPIAELARGCDLLVHDAYMPATSGYHAAMKAHCSPLEAGRAAAQAGAKRLALVHLHRDWAARRAELAAEATKEFGGQILIPSDGETIDL